MKTALVIFSIAMLGLAAAQHTQTCGPRSCDLCQCSNGTCPEVLPAGGHLALFYNTSRADFAYEFESYAGPPADLFRAYLLSPKQYSNYLQQLPFSYYSFSVATARSGTCFLPDIDTKGRGLYIVFECANPSANCQLWYRVVPPDINQCSPTCPTGSVENGVCNENCLDSSCDTDGPDCIVQPPSPSIPPPPPPVASSAPVSPPPPISQSTVSPQSPAPPSNPACPPSCPQSQIGDGDCDNQCNYAGCSFDGGDCLNPCDPNPCSNGGTCAPDSSTTDQTDFVCTCAIGWCGSYCTSEERLNSPGLSASDYCKTKLTECEEEYPESDVYFCCEYKLLGSDTTCREATSSSLRLMLSALVAVLN